MRPGEIGERVRSVLARHVPAGVAAGCVARDEPLSSVGVDSIRSIELLLDLESTFEIHFPDELLTPENFRTLDSLESIVTHVLQSCESAS
jgi:acyl carrier protein